MQNSIIGLVAPKGSGKTFTVSQAISNMQCVAAFDMVREFGYMQAGCEPVMGEPQRFFQMLRQPSFKIAYRPVLFTNENGEERCPEFEPFVKLCYLRGDMFMVIDEAHYLCNSRMCPDMLVTAARIGRHRNLSIVYITQSFSTIAMSLRENTDELILWRNVETTTLEAIKKRCGEEIAKSVFNLRATVPANKSQTGKVVPGQMLRWSLIEGLISISE